METWDLLAGVIIGILGGGGIVSIWFKSKLDELNAIREKLNTERRKVYGEILAPYIKLFAKLNRGEPIEDISQEILSDDYKRSIFELTLLGSDEVVTAYTNLMQYFFRMDESEKQDTRKTIKLWGKLRLEIRKDLGNKNTKLNEIDLLKSEIKDIYKYEKF